MKSFADWFSNTTHGGPSYMRDSFLVLGALGVMITALAVWANYFRKSKPTYRRREHRRFSTKSEEKPDTPVSFQSEPEVAPGESTKSRRRRKRRREHRPRNPTLAEKGGLPPVRPDDVSPRGT